MSSAHQPVASTLTGYQMTGRARCPHRWACRSISSCARATSRNSRSVRAEPLRWSFDASTCPERWDRRVSISPASSPKSTAPASRHEEASAPCRRLQRRPRHGSRPVSGNAPSLPTSRRRGSLQELTLDLSADDDAARAKGHGNPAGVRRRAARTPAGSKWTHSTRRCGSTMCRRCNCAPVPSCFRPPVPTDDGRCPDPFQSRTAWRGRSTRTGCRSGRCADRSTGATTRSRSTSTAPRACAARHAGR